MPRNVRSVTVSLDEAFGMAQIMLDAKLTSPFDSNDKRQVAHSVLDIPWAKTPEDRENGFMGQYDVIDLAKNIAATIDRCISIDRNGY